MRTYPPTQHDIARLRHEERLARAALCGAARTHLGLRRGVSAVRASFP